MALNYWEALEEMDMCGMAYFTMAVTATSAASSMVGIDVVILYCSYCLYDFIKFTSLPTVQVVVYCSRGSVSSVNNFGV